MIEDIICKLRLPYYSTAYILLDENDNVISAYKKVDGKWVDNTDVKKQEYKLKKQLAETAKQLEREKNRANPYLNPRKVEE